jgi:hypothetical protein
MALLLLFWSRVYNRGSSPCFAVFLLGCNTLPRVLGDAAIWNDCPPQLLVDLPTNLSKASCGSQLSYMLAQYSAFVGRSHATADAGVGAPKVVVWSCHDDPSRNESLNCAGLGDRLAGMSTAFIYALATRRVFMLDWDLASVGFLPATFDWRVRKEWLTNRSTAGGGFDDSHRNHTADVVVFSGNRASLHTILNATDHNNPLFWWRRRLLSFGLRRSHGFGCLLRSLIQPSQAVRTRFAREIAQLGHASTFSIGIHFRTGDSVMYGAANATFDENDVRFQVAEALSRRYARESRSILWMIVSDSTLFRESCARRFRSRFFRRSRRRIVVPNVAPAHISMVERISWGHDLSRSREEAVEAVITSVGEWYLLSLCSINILDGWSGFSRTAAAFSLGPMVNWRENLSVAVDETPCWLSVRGVGLRM